MDPEDLRSLIDAGSMSRPAIIQQQRSEIERITGISPPQDFGEMAEWWRNNKSYVSRKVNEQLPDEDEEGNDESEEVESDSNESDSNEVKEVELDALNGQPADNNEEDE